MPPPTVFFFNVPTKSDDINFRQKKRTLLSIEIRMIGRCV